MAIEYEHKDGTGWNDRSCNCGDCKQHFICEKTIYPTLTLTEDGLIEGTGSQAELICKSELTGIIITL